MIRYVEFNTRIGRMGAAEKGGVLSHLWVVGQKYAPDCSLWRMDASVPVFWQLQQQLHEYFSGTRRLFALPFAAHGTSFQKSVWEAVLSIPYGQLQSYSDLAQAIGNDCAVRAVGTAVGRNPLLILIPCHRVIGKNGGLTGFAAGVALKEQLLRLESSGAHEEVNNWELESEYCI